MFRGLSFVCSPNTENFLKRPEENITVASLPLVEKVKQAKNLLFASYSEVILRTDLSFRDYEISGIQRDRSRQGRNLPS